LNIRFAFVIACSLGISGCPTPAPQYECGSYECTQVPVFCDCPDAGSDGGSDAGRDAGSDAGVDASLDGGPRAGLGWQRFADVTECEIDFATNPGSYDTSFLVPVDCGAGCRGVSASGHPVLGVLRIAGRSLAIVSDGTSAPPSLTYVRVLVDLDGGPALAALRSFVDASDHTAPYCETTLFAANGNDLGFDVIYMRSNAPGDVFLDGWDRLYRGPYDDLASSVRRIGARPADRLPDDSGIYELALPTGVGLGPDFGSLSQNGTMYASQSDGSMAIVSPSAALPLHVGEPFQVGGDLLFNGVVDTDQRVVLARSVHGATATLLRSVAGGDLVDFASDGHSIAWLEGQGYDAATDTFTSLDLWSATYDGDLHPSFVRSMNVHRLGTPAVGAGYFVQDEADATTTSTRVFAIYRLSDGARATFDPGTLAFHDATDRALMVTADEIAFRGDGFRILRVDPRTLHFL
jgi:hypothetical protein